MSPSSSPSGLADGPAAAPETGRLDAGTGPGASTPRKRPWLGADRCLLLGHLVCAAAGVLAAAVAGSVLASHARPSPSRWVTVDTGCWVSVPWAYNDPHAPQGILADYAAKSSSLLNFVWCNEYSGAHSPIFSNIGHGGYLEEHLFWIEHAAATPGVEGIIYTNAPGLLGNFLESEDTLVAVPLLERIRRDYPETAPDVDAYLGCLLASNGYQRALAECGADWRGRVDLEAGELRPRGARYLLKSWIDGQLGFMAPLRAWATSWRISPPFRGPDGALRGRRAPKSARAVQLLDECAARYLAPFNQKGMKRPFKKEEIWNAAGGEKAWTAWAHIVAKICAARGTKLVFYAPPHVNLVDAASRALYRHEYVDKIKRTFSPFGNVVVLDHDEGQTLRQSDTLWNLFPATKLPYNSAEVPNIVGRLKSARWIIDSLLRAGLLAGPETPPRWLGSAWPGERSLPATSLALDFLPEAEQQLVKTYDQTEEARVRSSPASTSAHARANRARGH